MGVTQWRGPGTFEEILTQSGWVDYYGGGSTSQWNLGHASQTNGAYAFSVSNAAFAQAIGISDAKYLQSVIASTSGATPYRIYLRGFGFTADDIPSNATITQIELVFERRAITANRARDILVNLVLGNTLQGSNAAITNAQYPTVFTPQTYLIPSSLTVANVFSFATRECAFIIR